MLDSAGECASISLFHLNEQHLSMLGDREKHSVVVLDPVLKSVRLPLPSSSSSASAAAAAGAAAGAAAAAGSGAAAAGAGASAAAAAAASPASVSYRCVQVTRADGFFVDGKAVSKGVSAQASGFSIEAFDR